MTDKVKLRERLGWICNTIFHQILAVVSMFILWTIFYNFESNSAFTWHMGLTAVGYVPLMAEAIILFSDANVWSAKLSRTTRCWIHGPLLAASAASISTGIILMINEKSGRHFRSTHALTGLTSWILVLVSQVLGLVAANAHRLHGLCPPVYLKIAHNLVGTAAFVCGVVSLGYGMHKHSFKSFTAGKARTAATVAMGLAAAWTIFVSLLTLMKHLKTVFS